MSLLSSLRQGRARVRASAFVVLAAALVVVSGRPASAQQGCYAAPAPTSPKLPAPSHRLTLNASTAKLGTLLPTYAGNVYSSELGLDFSQAVTPGGLIPKGTTALVTVFYHQGLDDVRPNLAGSSDGSYQRAGGHLMVQQELRSLFPGLFFCGGASMTQSQHHFAAYPESSTQLLTHLGVAFGYTLGGVTVTPYLLPAIGAYRDVSTRQDTLAAGGLQRNTDVGNDLELAVGANIRVGSLVVHTGYRLRDHGYLGNGVVVLSAGAWF